MGVFGSNRPARRKAEFDAGADRATPTGLGGLVKCKTGRESRRH